MLQTWLPLPSFKDSLQTLRTAELSLQRYHILEVLEYFHQPEETQLPADYDDHGDLDGHPLTTMWKGYELQLIEYGMQTCEEWAMRRGKQDPFYDKLSNHLQWASDSDDANMSKPNWFGDVDFHLSHQAALLRINRKHYSSYFVADGERPIIWPVSDYAT